MVAVKEIKMDDANEEVGVSAKLTPTISGAQLFRTVHRAGSLEPH